MRRMIPLVLAGLLFIPVAAPAQEAAPATDATPLALDLKSAVSLAEKNSLTLKGNQADLENKRTAAETAWSVFYPTASLTGSYAAGVTDPASPSAARNKLAVGITAGITLDPTLAFTVRRLWNDYAAAVAGSDQARARLVTDVKKYYFGLLLVTEQLAAMKNQTESAAKRFEAADFKFKNGFLSEIDKLNVEYAYRDKLYTLQTVQNNFDDGLRQLKDVCGIDPGRAVTLTDALPDTAALAPPADAAAVFSGNPDLRLLELNRAQTEILRDTALAALLPTVSIGGQLTGGFTADPVAASPFDAASWSSSTAAGLSVNVSVPLDSYLPFSSTQRALSAQNAAVAKAGYAVATQLQTLKRQVAGLLATLKQLGTQIDSLGVNIAMAERSLALTEQLYNAGQKSFLDLKDAENNLSNARVQLISARNDYLSGFLDLEYLLVVDLGL